MRIMYWFECFVLYLGDLVIYIGDKKIWFLFKRFSDILGRVGIDVIIYIEKFNCTWIYVVFNNVVNYCLIFKC